MLWTELDIARPTNTRHALPKVLSIHNKTNICDYKLFHSVLTSTKMCHLKLNMSKCVRIPPCSFPTNKEHNFQVSTIENLSTSTWFIFPLDSLSQFNLGIHLRKWFKSMLEISVELTNLIYWYSNSSRSKWAILQCQLLRPRELLARRKRKVNYLYFS